MCSSRIFLRFSVVSSFNNDKKHRVCKNLLHPPTNISLQNFSLPLANWWNLENSRKTVTVCYLGNKTYSGSLSVPHSEVVDSSFQRWQTRLLYGICTLLRVVIETFVCLTCDESSPKLVTIIINMHMQLKVPCRVLNIWTTFKVTKIVANADQRLVCSFLLVPRSVAQLSVIASCIFWECRI